MSETGRVCSCGRTAPVRCPLHGDEANASTDEAWTGLVEATGARPGGPMRLVPDVTAPASVQAEATR